MPKLLRIISSMLWIAGLAMLFERSAYAYADPGTGLLAVQAVGSVVVATGWYLRRKISSLLHWNGAEKPATEAHPAREEHEGSTSR
jgi:hypothetical protein